MSRIIKAEFGNKKLDENQDIEDKYINMKKDIVKLELSLSEAEKSMISDLKRETLLDELNSFPPINKGEIDIVGSYTFDMGDYLEVQVFLRNGMERNVDFDKVPFVILNSKNEILAAQIFNMQDIGVLPPHTARPYKLNFDKANVHVDKISSDDWHIVFDNVETVEYENFKYGELPDTLSEKTSQVLNDFLKSLPKIEKGRYDLSKFNIGINENGELIASIVIRNGFDKPLGIEKLPVTIKNEEGNRVFSAIFDVHDFKVNPGEAKFFNLKCETEIRFNQKMDLSNWELIFRA
ncbi:SLAP domain-containing protein [Clostridium sp. WILCCON 0269]|uniref:SLAP domain-containing protein n=1 Tax=Candidatus Clostridium eludens TaxID=3381663 RepID=A0ABW8SGL5_9CLOT